MFDNDTMSDASFLFLNELRSGFILMISAMKSYQLLWILMFTIYIYIYIHIDTELAISFNRYNLTLSITKKTQKNQ